jgi:hypothetical protein
MGLFPSLGDDVPAARVRILFNQIIDRGLKVLPPHEVYQSGRGPVVSIVIRPFDLDGHSFPLDRVAGGASDRSGVRAVGAELQGRPGVNFKI